MVWASMAIAVAAERGHCQGRNGEVRGPPSRPVIGHMKAEGHLGRCYLKGHAGDAANTILTAVGYNLRRVLAWLRAFLRKILIAILRAFIIRSALNPAC